MTPSRIVTLELRMMRETALALPRRDLDPATWQPGEPLFHSPRELAYDQNFLQVARPIFQLVRDQPFLPWYDGRCWCRSCDVEWNRLDPDQGGASCWCCGREGEARRP